MPSRIKTERRTRSVPEGLWIKCSACDAVLYRAELERNLNVCPKCSHHMRIGARERLARFLDEGEQIEIGAKVSPEDPLRFRDSKRYRDRLAAAQKATGERDALIVHRRHARRRCKSSPARSSSSFSAARWARWWASDSSAPWITASRTRAPLVCFSSSGGARMQEALFSLMQMAKTSAALARLAQARLPFISVLTDPTTGGVSASLAMLGDLNVAEPRALIGFAGPRVIQQTVRETLPEGFQRSEFLLDHGALDLIIDRRDMRETARGVAAAADAPGRRPRPATPRRRSSAGLPIVRSLAEWLEQQQKSHPSAIDLDAEPRARGRAAPRPARARASGRSPSAAPTARVRRSPASMRCCAPPDCAAAVSPRRISSRYNERICVDGVEASDAELIACFRAHRCGARRHHAHVFRIQRARGARSFSRASRVDVAVLEVGLGGRLDATNIIDADVGCRVLDRPRSRRLAGRHARGDRPREGRHFPSRAVRRCWAAPTCRRLCGRQSTRSARAPVVPGRDFRARARHGATLGFRIRRGVAARSAAARARRSTAARQCRHRAGRDRAGGSRRRISRTRMPSGRRCAACGSPGRFPAHCAGRSRVDTRCGAQRTGGARDSAANLRALPRAPHARGVRNSRRQGHRRNYRGACARDIDAWILVAPRGPARRVDTHELATAIAARTHAFCGTSNRRRRRLPHGARRGGKPGDRILVFGSFPHSRAGARISLGYSSPMDSRAKQRLTGAVILVACSCCSCPNYSPGRARTEALDTGASTDEGMRRYTIDFDGSRPPARGHFAGRIAGGARARVSRCAPGEATLGRTRRA